MSSYLTYDYYEDAGGTLSEDDFDIIVKKAEMILDVYTFKRIPIVLEAGHPLPDEVPFVMMELISRLYKQDNYEANTGSGVISSYSNGVETFKYRNAESEKDVKKQCKALIIDYLPWYLTNRMVNFDVRKYL